jgi:acetate kinase
LRRALFSRFRQSHLVTPIILSNAGSTISTSGSCTTSPVMTAIAGASANRRLQPLGGLDTFIFAGGIGEHAPEVRAAICQGLNFLGLQLDASENARASDIISTNQNRATIRIIPTDEEIVIARIVRSILQHPAS